MPPAYVSRSLWSSLPREFLVSLPLLWCGYLGITEQGPWLWVAELQLWLFNAYYPSYTFAGCFMIGIGGSVLLSAVLERAGWRAHSFSLQGVIWVLGLPNWLGIPFGVGLVIFVLALWRYVPMQLAGPRTEIRAAELEAGTKPESRWLAIHGTAPPGLSVEWKKEGKVNRIDACFVSPEWRPPQPVTVVLTASAAAQLPAPEALTTIEGTASAMGVPGLTRSALEAGGLSIAENAVYLDVSETPANAGSGSLVLAAVGLGAMILVVLIGNVRAARQRPAQVASMGWAVGAAVAARGDQDRYYYAGVIVKANGPKYLIQFEDGDRSWVTVEQIVFLNLQPGTRVQARWKNGADYFPGAILQVDGPRLLIRYDDGYEEWTTLSLIRF